MNSAKSSFTWFSARTAIPTHRAPAGARARLALLRSFDPLSPPGADVPDPYYGGPEGFALVHDLCVRAARGLLDHLRPGPPPADQRQ